MSRVAERIRRRVADAAAAVVDDAASFADLKAVRAQVDENLNRFGADLATRTSAETDAMHAGGEGAADPVTEVLQARVAQLGQVAAGLAVVDPECLPVDGAGFGSYVEAMNVDTGERQAYTLMIGTLVDINANQVSLASPIGQALLGRSVGDEITVTTPQRSTRLRVTAVETLMQRLRNVERSFPAP